jgi:hypothetical protein
MFRGQVLKLERVQAHLANERTWCLPSPTLLAHPRGRTHKEPTFTAKHKIYNNKPDPFALTSPFFFKPSFFGFITSSSFVFI